MARGMKSTTGSEEATWRYVKDHLGPGWYLERHTDKLSGGVPDVFWARAHVVPGASGFSGWVELKQRDTPRQQLDIRQDQLANLWQKTRHGVSAVVLCQTGRAWDLWYPRRDPSWLDFLTVRPAPDVHWDAWPGSSDLFHALVEAPLWARLALAERRH